MSKLHGLVVRWLVVSTNGMKIQVLAVVNLKSSILDVCCSSSCFFLIKTEIIFKLVYYFGLSLSYRVFFYNFCCLVLSQSYFQKFVTIKNFGFVSQLDFFLFCHSFSFLSFVTIGCFWFCHNWSFFVLSGFYFVLS